MTAKPGQLLPSPIPMFPINFHGATVNVELALYRYLNGRLCVDLVSKGEDFAGVSVNIPEAHIGPDEFAFKTYSENEGLYEELIRTGVVASTGRYARCAVGWLPICCLTYPEEHLHVGPAVERAMDAFWETIVKIWPEAKSGDLSPERTISFEIAAEKAVAEWYMNNCL